MAIEPSSSEVPLFGYAEQQLLKTLHGSTEDLIVIAAQMIVGLRGTDTDKVAHIFDGLHPGLRLKIVDTLGNLLEKPSSELASLGIDESDEVEFARLNTCLKVGHYGQGVHPSGVLYLYLAGRCTLSYIFDAYKSIVKKSNLRLINTKLLMSDVYQVRGKDKEALTLYYGYVLGRLHVED